MARLQTKETVPLKDLRENHPSTLKPTYLSEIGGTGEVVAGPTYLVSGR